jgi:ribosomal protein S18 acetylase RimI-like enzyme
VSAAIRDYRPADEPSWLRCRVLSFLGTSYFDDVHRHKPEVSGLELVAVDPGDTVIGILDASIDGELATIDTVAVHPDHQHRGIGRALLAEALVRLRALGVPTLDAWTRDDEDTLRWYRACGFTESDHYVHVYVDHYLDPAEPRRAIVECMPGLRPVRAFFHAGLADERAMRERFSRVHVCRRFALRP